jgi:hypothetical protein
MNREKEGGERERSKLKTQSGNFGELSTTLSTQHYVLGNSASYIQHEPNVTKARLPFVCTL